MNDDERRNILVACCNTLKDAYSGEVVTIIVGGQVVGCSGGRLYEIIGQLRAAETLARADVIRVGGAWHWGPPIAAQPEGNDAHGRAGPLPGTGRDGDADRPEVAAVKGGTMETEP